MEGGGCRVGSVPDAVVLFRVRDLVVLGDLLLDAVCVRTGSGTGPPRGKRAPEAGISSTIGRRKCLSSGGNPVSKSSVLFRVRDRVVLGDLLFDGAWG